MDATRLQYTTTLEEYTTRPMEPDKRPGQLQEETLAQFMGISSAPLSRRGCCSGAVRSPPRASTHNIDVGWKNFDRPLQNGAQAAPAISSIARRGYRLNENVARKGHDVHIEWQDVQWTIHAKRRLSM